MLYTPKRREKIEISNDDLYDSMREKLIENTFETLEEILGVRLGDALDHIWYVEGIDISRHDWEMLNKELLYRFYNDLVDELCDYLNHEDEMRDCGGFLAAVWEGE